jgi:type III secretory pathway component EscS
MEECLHYFRTAFLTVMTLLSLGCICVLSVVGLIVFHDDHIFDFSPATIGILVGVLVASLVLFCFAMYVACGESSPCQGRILGVIFFVFAAGVLTLAIFGFTDRKGIVEKLSAAWTPPISTADRVVATFFEHGFGCCGWAAVRAECENATRETCADPVNRGFDRYCEPVSGFLIGLAVLLGVATIVSCMKRHIVSEFDTDQLSMRRLDLGLNDKHWDRQGYTW